MRILTEAEFERLIEKAKAEGAREEERRIMERQEYEGFRRSIWDELDGMRTMLGRFDQRLDAFGAGAPANSAVPTPACKMYPGPGDPGY